MTPLTLAWRGLAHHWRSHLGVLLGAAIGCAVLVGALVVGDSVRYSLRTMALLRLGQVRHAVASGERMFRAALAEEVAAELKAPATAVLQLPGAMSRGDGQARAGNVQVLGVDAAFWKLGGDAALAFELKDGEAVLNERLARQLGVASGDAAVLKINKPSGLSRDAPLSTEDDATLRLRVTVKAVIPDLGFGRFSLQANQVPPYNAFVALPALQKLAGTGSRANLLLLGGEESTLEAADAALRKHWKLADAELELRELEPVPGKKVAELRTRRVFLDPETAEKALGADPAAEGVLGYFVNDFKAGDRTVPYSIVAGLAHAPVPAGMQDNEIVVNQWLADQLAVKEGADLDVTYYVMGPLRKLEEQTRKFRVRQVVPIAGAAADRDLMPDFPGLKDAEDCREWDPGFKIDTKKIRPQDEDYWDGYRGTPKAFVTLRAARSIWKNRFGELTAVRYPRSTGFLPQLEARLRETIDPKLAGLQFVPVRKQAMDAGAQAMDFGGLFIGFSFFLILAALLLMGLLFRFALEQRSTEAGILLALGFTPASVRRLLLLEGLGLALLGGVLGAALGAFYARAMLYGLSTVWRSATQTSALFYHAEPATLAMGAGSGVVIVLLTIWLGVRGQARRPARELLASGAAGGGLDGVPPRSRGAWLGAGCVALAVALVAWAGPGRDAAAAGAFFGAGFLLLGGGLAFGAAWLARLARGVSTQPTLGGLSLRNLARRRGRSLATLGLLASGVFLVVAVGANRLDPAEGAERRASGAGGFALFAQTSLPVVQDLNGPGGRETYILTENDMREVSVVPFRVRAGDDASCLNLNRAQTPQLWGVQPKQLAERGAFSFAAVTGVPSGSPWLLLDEPQADGTVPAIGDMNSVAWALGKSAGETLDYVDGRGNAFKVRIVATLATSILQGGLVIAENRFIERFPDESGYRMFLIDTPRERAEATAKLLSERLEDTGIEVVPSARRLAEFNAVQNTYLSTFQVLGGLGLLLGTAGLGVLVLRNVLERRAEFALLRAVGFPLARVRLLVAGEHAVLLLAGLGCGLLAALVAVLPALRSPGAEVPYLSLSLTVAAVAASGILWTAAAAVFALGGRLLDGLRDEAS